MKLKKFIDLQEFKVFFSRSAAVFASVRSIIEGPKKYSCRLLYYVFLEMLEQTND